MSPRSIQGWPDWEEKNLLPWLHAHRALSWKSRAEAYFEQYGVYRSVESLRGKKYDILRKRCRGGACSEQPGKQKRPGVAYCSMGGTALLATLTNETHPQKNFSQWLQTIPAAEPSHTSSSESTQIISGRAMPAPIHYQPETHRHLAFGTMYIVSVQPGGDTERPY
ncbi:unnamed protein product [Penicillium viridicatum]